LAELEQLKNNFVSLISHDLKTPIAKIQAIVDRLLNDSATLNFQGDLKSLRLSSDELNRYIQSILKVLRVESRDFQLNKEVGDINETVQEAIEQLTPLASEKGIQIESNLEPMFSIEVDFTLMREVLINLLENAIKYTPVGGKIQIASHEVAEKVWIEVQDTGEGIPAVEIANVWGKFVRGKDQDHKTKGTGLGLYLVKYFIELHGGEVFLESELGKGTKVSFSLPLEEESAIKTQGMEASL
jgi:signal transduction histidine kinase